MRAPVQYNDALWSTPATEKTVYNTFAASKVPQAKSGSMHVEYTNVFGQTQYIVCKNRTQLREASEFLGMFKAEELTIKTICAQYNVKMGKFQNVAQLKKELAAVTGMTAKGLKRLTCLK
jgi:hypothetical protein